MKRSERHENALLAFMVCAGILGGLNLWLGRWEMALLDAASTSLFFMLIAFNED